MFFFCSFTANCPTAKNPVAIFPITGYSSSSVKKHMRSVHLRNGPVLPIRKNKKSSCATPDHSLQGKALQRSVEMEACPVLPKTETTVDEETSEVDQQSLANFRLILSQMNFRSIKWNDFSVLPKTEIPEDYALQTENSEDMKDFSVPPRMEITDDCSLERGSSIGHQQDEERRLKIFFKGMFDNWIINHLIYFLSIISNKLLYFINVRVHLKNSYCMVS